MVSTIILDPYDLVIFEEKGDICKVIAVSLIITKPRLVPALASLTIFFGVYLLLQP